MRKNRFLAILTVWTTVLVLGLNLVIPPGLAFAFTEKGQRTSSREQIAEGVVLEQIKIDTTDGPLNVHVLTVDLNNPYVKLDTMVGKNGIITQNQSVSNMAKEYGAVAAINGDFFQMNEHAPIGVAIQSGELITSPAITQSMNSFGLTKDNRPVFGLFGFEGTVTAPDGSQFQLSGVNKPTYLIATGVNSDVNRLNMYTPKWGALSRGAISGLKGMVEMVVEYGVVKEIRVDQPGTLIPLNGYVLAGHGTAGQFLTGKFKVGDPVFTSYTVTTEPDNLAMAVGGQAILVRDGKRHWFSNNIPGNRARTAIGASRDGKTIYMVVVDGGNNSRGMTQEELADFMISIGAWTALNLDGGGSSTLVARHLADETVSLINAPVYNSERSVPTAIGIFSTAPPGDLGGLVISGPANMLVGTKRAFTAKGYDNHFNPYRVNQDDVIWEIDPALGQFEGNTLVAVSAGQGKVKATYNGVSQEYPVRILGSADISKVEVNPPAIALNPGDSVNFTVKVTTKQGLAFTLQPGEYQAEVNGEVGSVTNGKFTAGNDLAAGELKITVDSTTVAVKVSVGGIEKPFYGFEDAKAVSFNKLPAEVSGSFRLTKPGEPSFRGAGAARLEYDFTGTSQTRFAYGHFDNGLVLPGQPLGMGLRVKGDGGNGHWLRVKIIDAAGKEKLLTLADAVDWKGWRYVSTNFPSDIKLPVKISDIYLVATEGRSQDKGVIYFDELTLISPPAPGETGQPPEALTVTGEILPGTSETLTLGNDMTISFQNAAGTTAFTVNAGQVWKTELPTPGYNPLMPLYNISGMANGAKLKELPVAAEIKIKIKGIKDPNKARLMLWDEAKAEWTRVSAVVDAEQGILTAKTKSLGLFGLMEDVTPVPVFSDIDSSWAKDIIIEMASRGIVSGYPDGRFMPEKGVTRAEFVTLLANTLGWDAGPQELKFKDQIPQWARGSIAAAVSRGVVTGYEDGTFRPGKVISRAEMAVILDKALALPKSNQPSNYKDAAKIPSWAVQSIRNTKAAGIMQGSNGMFRPQDMANRAESTAVMAKILNY